MVRIESRGDNWRMTWADDDQQYVSLCDGSGFPGMPQEYNSRAYAIAGEPPTMSFAYLPGYPDLFNVPGTRDISRYYNFGILALDGWLYQLMANWGMGCDATGNWFGKPSYLGFWTAPAPWGPWTQVHEEEAWMPASDPNARAYQPQIAPKWIAQDDRSFWLVWTDFQPIDGDRPYYCFNVQQVEASIEGARQR